MSQIAKAVIGTIEAQKTQIALADCFHSWDGTVDIGVIVSGLSDRFTAMGKDVEEISFERKELKSLTVLVDGRRSIVLTKTDQYIGGAGYDFKKDNVFYTWFSAKYDNLFNKEEKELMTEWLMNNMHNL